MVLYIVGGEGFDGAVSEFETMGISIDRSMNISFMKAPVCGSQDFLQQFSKDKMVAIKKVFEGIKGIRGRHVGLYLLRTCANVCRVVYYCRAVPREMLAELLDDFDHELREAVEEFVGLTLLKENQWAQATLLTKGGGLVIKEARGVADAAYAASRGMTAEASKNMDPRHVLGRKRKGCRDWGKLSGSWGW